jgi:lactoylglutathione lyase
MKYLHTMVRVTDLDASSKFYCDALGLREVRRMTNDKGRFTLVYLAAPGDEDAQIELTYNWDPETYTGGRNFGHVAYQVDDIYATCELLMQRGVTINRPPRDGKMAFVRSPDLISIELLQKGAALPPRNPGFDAKHRQLVAALQRARPRRPRLAAPLARRSSERPRACAG